MRWTDERAEQLIGNLLGIGVIVAASVVLVGGAVYLARHGADPHLQQAFQGEPENLKHPGGVFADALAFSGRGIIQFGILLMIAVPVLRVAASIWVFALERDWTYVAITLAVFAILSYSLFSGQLR